MYNFYVGCFEQLHEESIYGKIILLISVNLHTKFEMPSAIRSKSTIGPQKLKMSHVTVTTPMMG